MNKQKIIGEYGLKDKSTSTPYKGAVIFFLILFIIYSILLLIIKNTSLSFSRTALNIMELRYWEYTGYALFIIFIISTIASLLEMGKNLEENKTSNTGVAFEEVRSSTIGNEGITSVEKYAIPAKMTTKKGKKDTVEKKEKEVVEYPYEVGPGIYGDTYIPIVNNRILKLRTLIVEQAYLGAKGND